MILLFDVGNTNVTIGLSDGIQMNHVYRLNTNVTLTADQYYIDMKNLFDFNQVEHVAISSVVPRLTEKLKEICQKHMNLTPLIVGPGVKTGVNIKTDHPKEVGADLICDAAGVDDDLSSTLVVDLGTAVKYIYVKDKMIKGVVISPGVTISIKALVGHTALLPDIDIEVPKKVLGTNTIHCMQSGVTYGVAAEVDGMITRIQDEVHESFKVILTGGLSDTIAPLCREEAIRDGDLTLKGLLKIFYKNQ